MKLSIAVPLFLAFLTLSPPASAVLIDSVGDTGSLTGSVGGTARLFGVDGSVLQGIGNSKVFLTVQNNGTERGYNTDGAVEFDTTASGTTSLLLSEIPQLTFGGVNYYAFGFAANQTGGSPLLSINQIQIMQAAAGNLTGYNAGGPNVGGATTLVFDWASNGEFLTVGDFVPGLSDTEMMMLVPASSFGAGSFVILYMNAGNSNESNAGPDKWLVFENAACPGCEPTPQIPVPEPGSLALLSLALAVAGWRWRRRRN